jgi:hypothetical protein
VAGGHRHWLHRHKVRRQQGSAGAEEGRLHRFSGTAPVAPPPNQHRQGRHPVVTDLDSGDAAVAGHVEEFLRAANVESQADWEAERADLAGVAKIREFEIDRAAVLRTGTMNRPGFYRDSG